MRLERKDTLNDERETIQHIQRESSFPGLLVNFDRAEAVRVDGERYSRLCIKTPLVTVGEDLEEFVRQYAEPFLHPGDVLIITEKIVAIAQGRAMPAEQIHPGLLARFLSWFVTRTSYGIGLAIPETMECALKECGRLKILIAAGIGALGKIFGKHGWFYRVAGIQAAGIDGPCDCTIPPYNRWIVLSPKNASQVAVSIRDSLQVKGVRVAVIDFNDIGGEIIGCSDEMNLRLFEKILADNPLRQGNDQTPMGIVRII